MLAKEAYKILTTKHKNLKAVNCREYNSLFVFQVVPKDFDMSKPTNKMIGNTMSVDKKTKEVRDFKPFHIPIDEFRGGKEIKNFM